MSFIYLLNTLNSHVKWNNMVSLQVQHGDSLALQKININTSTNSYSHSRYFREVCESLKYFLPRSSKFCMADLANTFLWTLIVANHLIGSISRNKIITSWFTVWWKCIKSWKNILLHSNFHLKKVMMVIWEVMMEFE